MVRSPARDWPRAGACAPDGYKAADLPLLRPTAYRPRDQFEALLVELRAAPQFLAVRTAGDPIDLARAIRSAGQAMWPGATFTSLRRLDSYSSEPLARSRVTVALFVAFAAVCLLLSTIGLYRVVTAHVVERTREVGIRMALGASRGAVLRAVLLEGAMMTLIGMIGGAAIAALFSGWLETILYGVSRHDFATIASVAVLMCLVTGVATYIPADAPPASSRPRLFARGDEDRPRTWQRGLTHGDPRRRLARAASPQTSCAAAPDCACWTLTSTARAPRIHGELNQQTSPAGGEIACKKLQAVPKHGSAIGCERL